MNNKKAQMEALANWFYALIIIFVITMGFIVFTKPIRIVDEKISAQLEGATYGGKNIVEDVFPRIRKNYIAMPVILIGGVLLIAFLASLKQDPNYPQQ